MANLTEFQYKKEYDFLYRKVVIGREYPVIQGNDFPLKLSKNSTIIT
ncbi:MAG TPA: hypothetical protein VGK25_11350 [Ignavibacteria bacterium]